MKRKHFSEEQIVTALKRVDGGESAAEDIVLDLEINF